jgi:predicted alpha/beta superfamily hydrolase
MNVAAATPDFKETSPVAVPRERQFDFTSRLNQLPYRLMISAPALEPGKTYPVLYVLDGNWYFRAVSDTALWGSGPFEPAIVVGIGYPVPGNPAADYPEVRRRRGIDYTVKEEPQRFPTGSGGCDTFLRIIEEEIKSFIAANYPVDAKRSMIYGKSLGGLAVVHALLSKPTAFSTYIAVSPSIWQADKAVLANEAAFAAKARAGELNLRILITSASEEEYTGTDPVKLAQENGFMITNARQLAERLSQLNPAKVNVKYVIFADETHNQVSLASIGRGLVFALPAAAPR